MASTELHASPAVCKVADCTTPPAKGRKGLCFRHYRRERSTGSTDFPRRYEHCQAEGCDKPPRSGYATHCETHYYQIRRNGYLGPKRLPPPPRLSDHTGGYKLLYAPKHPLATRRQQSRVYEHRAVYYEHHGEGPFKCVHCRATVTWKTMHVDHLDDDPTNNDIGNLGASCPTCNQRRGHWKMKRAIRDRVSRKITWRGRTQTLCDWAVELGFSHSMLKQRLTAGWSLDRAMTEPRGKFGPKGKAGGLRET